jgi:hypothetical protein
MLSSLADGPSVIGWWRPVILLPSATLLGLSPWQLEAVLAHELAHIRRRDYLVNLLQSVVEILLFYHPAVWWVSNCVRRERELCCDDLAVAISGDAVGYARALTILERQRLALPQARSAMAATWPTLAAAGGWIGLRVRRLVGLVQDPNRPTFVSGLLALGLALGILAVGVNSSDSVAQEGAQEPREPAVNVNLEPVVEPIEIQLEPIETQLRNLEGELQNLDLDVGRYYAQVVEEGRVLPPGVTLSTGVTFNQDGRRARWLDSVGWGGQFSDVDRVINAARSSELSAAQVAAVESIVESYRSQISSAAARVQSDEASLDALLTAETLDRGAATVRLESLISARGEVDRTAASMALAVRERLTLDEWTRLQSQLGNGIALYMRTNTAAPGGGGRGGFGAADGAGAGGSGRGGRRGGPPPTAPEGALPTAAPPPTGAAPTPQ